MLATFCMHPQLDRCMLITNQSLLLLLLNIIKSLWTLNLPELSNKTFATPWKVCCICTNKIVWGCALLSLTTSQKKHWLLKKKRWTSKGLYEWKSCLNHGWIPSALENLIEYISEVMRRSWETLTVRWNFDNLIWKSHLDSDDNLCSGCLLNVIHSLIWNCPSQG